MKAAALVAAAAVLALAPSARAQGTPRAQAGGPLSALSFMAGCWRGELGQGMTLEESWTASDADVMLAAARYLRGARATGYEFSRVQADSAGIALTPYPGGERSDSFPLVRSDAGLAVFENLRHDFPKRIVYRRVDDRTLVIRIEGETSDEGQEFRLSRFTCPGA